MGKFNNRHLILFKKSPYFEINSYNIFLNLPLCDCCLFLNRKKLNSYIMKTCIRCESQGYNVSTLHTSGVLYVSNKIFANIIKIGR